MSNSILCESINAKLDAFHDGELTAAERTEVVAHIGTCPACAKRLADIDAVKNSLQSLPLLTPKIDVATNFEQILAQRTAKQKVVRLPVIWGGIGVAAAAAVAIFVGHGLINPNPAVVGSVIPHSVNSTIASQPKDERDNLPADRLLDHGPKAATVNKNQKSTEKSELANAATTTKADKLNVSSKPKLEVQEVVHNADLESKRDRLNVDANKTAQEQSLIASNQNSTKTGSGRGSMDGAGSDEIASNPSQQNLGAGAIEQFNPAPVHVGNKGGRNLVAVYDAEQNNASEELGIATDEDGLYAIKL